MIEAGLGTAATRAQIIEDLMTRGYLYRTPEDLICVGPAGNQLMAILAAHGAERLTDAALTASWEQLLDRIGRRVKEKPIAHRISRRNQETDRGNLRSDRRQANRGAARSLPSLL